MDLINTILNRLPQVVFLFVGGGALIRMIMRKRLYIEGDLTWKWKLPVRWALITIGSSFWTLAGTLLIKRAPELLMPHNANIASLLFSGFIGSTVLLTYFWRKVDVAELGESRPWLVSAVWAVGTFVFILGFRFLITGHL